ncbi:immunity 26/phosphotriesterase HocA family protein [Actinomycetota bacterium Odt1-20B]
MQLKKMKGQRRQHVPGDVFVLQLEDDSYRFGRIVKVGESTPEARFPGGILAYIYDIPSVDQKPDLDRLTPDRLLMPPFFTMNWVWNKGYFRTVQHAELTPDDLLKQHCFYDAYYKDYVDENDQRISERADPCGSFALSNFDFFQEQVAAALAGNPIVGPRREDRQGRA